MQDLIASLYQYIFIIIVAICTIPIIKSYRLQSGLHEYNYGSSNGIALFLIAVLVIFIALRPLNEKYFVDMVAYSYHLRRMANETFVFSWDVDNKIFNNLLSWWGCNNLGEIHFFLFMAAIYFGCSYIGIKKLFPTHTIPAYLVFLGAFSTFSYATNGMKAGVATSIFIMALGYLDKKFICLLLAVISMGFHHSMQLPVAGLVITMFYKNPKWYFYGWFVSLLMAMLHITYFQNLFGGMTDDQGAGYLMIQEDTTAGGIRFRPDFILYSAIPVWIGYQFEMKKKLTSKIYSTLLHFYLVTNAIWMLCMYASFNNRIAYLSWFVYPIVLIYPFLYVDNSARKYVKFSKAVKYHLYFTLFMVIVYYGFFSLGH